MYEKIYEASIITIILKINKRGLKIYNLHGNGRNQSFINNLTTYILNNRKYSKKPTLVKDIMIFVESAYKTKESRPKNICNNKKSGR